MRRSPALPARSAPARSAPGRNGRRRSLALSRPRRSERGAALTELVMVLPLLFVLVLGLVESGLNWRTSSELATAVRSGLRTASALGSSPAADQALVLGVASALDGGSTLPDPEVVSCIVRAFYGLSFPAPEDGIVTSTYPIVLSPD